MLKEDFPLLANNPGFSYLDNAATTQKPDAVINTVKEYYENYNSNVHRGVYKISARATEKFEEAHAKTADFIQADSMREIVFTKNATESINLVASTLDWKKGDEVVTTLLEHHSNFVPWQQLKGIKLKVAGLDENLDLDLNHLQEKITSKTKLVAVTHASNAIGTINGVKKIVKMAHDNGSLCLVDAAQSVPHFPVSVKDLDCDFLAFSSHKMLGPAGIGVLYAREEWLKHARPFLVGGDMVKSVSIEKTEWNYLPWKFEAGTPNVEGAIGFLAALEYLKKAGMKKIQEHEQKLLHHALKQLSKLNFVKLYGKPAHKTGIISFEVKGVHAHDVAAVLDEHNVAIRAGHHCSQPLMKHLGVSATSRASFYLYNDESDVERLCSGLEEVAKVFSIR